MAKSHDECRKKALDGGYDYLLHLESDIFPPSDVIEQLLSANAKIVGNKLVLAGSLPPRITLCANCSSATGCGTGTGSGSASSTSASAAAEEQTPADSSSATATAAATGAAAGRRGAEDCHGAA